MTLLRIILTWILLSINATFQQDPLKILFLNQANNEIAGEIFEEVINYLSTNGSIQENDLEIEKVILTNKSLVENLEDICTVYATLMTSSDSAPIIIDTTFVGAHANLVKRFTASLNLPTISASYGEQEDYPPWTELDPAQKRYLIQIQPPCDLIPQIIRSLVKKQQFTNAAILFDDNFVMEHKYKSLLQNLPCRHFITRIRHPFDEQLRGLKDMDLTNYFILGSLPTIAHALLVVCGLDSFNKKYAWYVITPHDGELDLTCENASVVFIQPKSIVEHHENGSVFHSGHFGVDGSMTEEFYFNFFVQAILTAREVFDRNPVNFQYIPCMEFNGTRPFSLDLDVLKVLKNFSEVGFYEPFNITENGLSHMVFNMTLTAYNVVNGTLKTRSLGEWQAGWNTDVELDKDLTDLSNYTAKRVLKVVTKVQHPFVYGRDLTTGKFSGYCIDLLDEIARTLNFDYEIYEVPDDKWGDIDDQGKWNGIIRELIDKNADVGIGSISVTADREQVVDFTAPFYDLVGISIMMKKPESVKSLFKFLTVLDTQVWLMILAAYFFTSLFLYFFERFSPYSYRNNKPSCHTETRLFNVKECFWFSMTSLTPQGGGEAPQNFSSRLVAAVWWMFGFIIIASYTANLAAFLTVSRLEATIESLEDLSKQFKVAYAPVEGLYVHRYFQRMAGIEERFYNIWKDMTLNDSLNVLERSKLAVWDYPMRDTYTKMYKAMQEAGFPKNLEEGIERVKSSTSGGDGFALLADATDIRYQQLVDCRVHMVGQEFSKTPYSIALQKYSALKDQFNSMVLTLLNTRKLEKFKERWWGHNPNRVECGKMEDASDGISIENIGGVFIVIFVGILLSCVTLGIEYYYYKMKKDQKIKWLKNELLKYTDPHKYCRNKERRMGVQSFVIKPFVE